jgi:hypothetical protein
MVEDKKKINLDIDQKKDAFYANNIALFNNPTEFVLDFTQVTPRINMVQSKQIITYVVKHNPIVLEPRQAKILLDLLGENIARYEKKFGKIKLPKGKKQEKESLTKKFSDYIG